MGVPYPICCSQTTRDQQIQKLKVSILKLKSQLTLSIPTIKQDITSKQKDLLKQFNKQKKQRSIHTERPMITGIVLQLNKITILEIYIVQMKRLLENQFHFGSKQTSKQWLYPSFQILFYSQPFLQDNNITQVCTQITKLFKDIGQPKEEAITCQLMKYHKKQLHPNQEMINSYLLKFINDKNLNFDQINSIGHNIKYQG